MGMFLSVCVIFVVFSSILLVRFIFSLRFPSRTVPGPVFAKFTDGWYYWNIRKGSFQETNQQLHKKFGTIIRYGPNRYSFSDPKAIKAIYGLGKSFPKSSWYSAAASPGQWTLFSDQSTTRHAQNRKLYQAMYSMSALVHYEPFVDECIELFIQRLAELSKTGLQIDMGRWFQFYAFDVIGLITYGKRLGFLDRGEDVGGVISALDDLFDYAAPIGVFPSFHQHLLPLRNYLAGARGAGRAHIVRFTNERMRESQATPRTMFGDGTFLTKFLAKHSVDPVVFSKYHVLAGCTSNMVAGSDTTAIGLSAILYYLLKSPTSLQKLKDEIDSFTRQGNLSASPSFKESQQMPYLKAVIKEALRMHPATGLPLERVVPEGGVKICGQFFPKGTIVGVNTWVAHRDTSVFGDNAELFYPERWLVEDGERLSLMNQCYMPFGSGSRTCIGRHVSMLEISKLIPRIIRDFDFELDPSLQRENWSTRNSFFVKPVNFKVQIEKRQPLCDTRA